MKKSYKILIGFFVAIVVILGCIACALKSDRVDKWLYDEGMELLSEEFNTRVKVDRISVNFHRGGVYLYGFEIDDLQKVPMLKVDTMGVSLEFLPLLKGDVSVDKIYLHGVKAVLYKENPDTAANYQFLVDKFKSKKAKKENKTEKKSSSRLNVTLKVLDVSRADFTWDVKSFPKKGEGKLDMHHLAVKNFRVKVKGDIMGHDSEDVEIRDMATTELNSGAEFSLKKVKMKASSEEKNTVSELKDLKFSLPGKVASIESVKITEPDDMTKKIKNVKISLHGLSYVTNNHKPRKNVGKPHRGAFDAGHLDLLVNVDATIDYAHKDTLLLSLNNLDMVDKGSGLIIKKATCKVSKYGGELYLKNTKISLQTTTVNLGTCHLTLKKQKPVAEPVTTAKSASAADTTKHKTEVLIAPTVLTAKVHLQDIAKPFAPVLSNFTTPLNLRTIVSGDLNRIVLSNILITSPKKRLVITAQGDMCDLTKKKQMNLHFTDINMKAVDGIKEQIVEHFSKKVNLKMQRQMLALGDVSYKGKVIVMHKREDISGTLFTKFGNLDFAFTLNGYNKYMTGTLDAIDFEVGKVMNVNKLGPVSMHADYSFCTKKDKSVKTKDKGKLPKGTLSAKIDGLKFSVLSLKHITADFKSDGSTANGTIILQQKLADVAIDVAYHQTEAKQNYTYKVHLKKISDNDKATRDAQRQQEKADKKAAKTAAKKAKNK